MDRIPTEELKRVKQLPLRAHWLCPNGQNSDRGIETNEKRERYMVRLGSQWTEFRPRN